MTISVLAPTWRLEFLPRPLSFPCLRQLSPSPSSPILSPPPNTTLSGGDLEVPQTRPSLSFQMVSMLAIQLLELVWNTKGAMKVNGRMPYPACQQRLAPPPTRVPETTPAAAAGGNPEPFWKGGAHTPRQGLLSAFPGLASLAHAALCPTSPLHQRAMLHYPRLVHHLPQRSGRTGKKKKSWPTTGRFSIPPRR